MKILPQITKTYLHDEMLSNLYDAWSETTSIYFYEVFGFNWRESKPIKYRFTRFLDHLESTAQLNKFFVYLYLKQKKL